MESQLLGFHLAGNGTYGAAGFLSKGEFDIAFEKLSSRVLVAHSMGELKTTQFDVDFTPDQPVPKRHAVNFMTNAEDGHEPSLEVFGSHGMGQVKFRSDVKTSPISEDVEEIMDLPRLHGPPNTYRIGAHWQRDLDSIAHTRGDFEPEAWACAQDDYKQLLDIVMEEHSDQMKFHPLSWMHTINGINGVKWIDKINTNSSMGFPINKSKKNFVDKVMVEIPGVRDPVDFTDPRVKISMEECEELYAQGERIYAVHRGNLKDEPTKFTKNKIRVFAGSQIVFTLIVKSISYLLLNFCKTMVLN
jgi:hypothetical protein